MRFLIRTIANTLVQAIQVLSEEEMEKPETALLDACTKYLKDTNEAN